MRLKLGFAGLPALALLLPVLASAQSADVPAAAPSFAREARTLVVDTSFTDASERLTSGEFKHVVEVPVTAGDRLVAQMISREVDPFLIVRSPTGAQVENDDCTPGDRNACLDWVADTTGTVRVIATTYAVGETGAFRLALRVVPLGSDASAREVRCPQPAPIAAADAGEVAYLIRFAPDGRYVSSSARVGALVAPPARRLAVERIVGECRADAIPPGEPQVEQGTVVTFRVPAAP